jgi:hypothetical protein
MPFRHQRSFSSIILVVVGWVELSKSNAVVAQAKRRRLLNNSEVTGFGTALGLEKDYRGSVERFRMKSMMFF